MEIKPRQVDLSFLGELTEERPGYEQAAHQKKRVDRQLRCVGERGEDRAEPGGPVVAVDDRREVDREHIPMAEHDPQDREASDAVQALDRVQ